ncbi:MAG: hypothetical protein ACREPG_10660, partial [Candidatus Binatia bacterium]
MGRVLILLILLLFCRARTDGAETAAIAVGAGQFTFQQHGGAADRAIKVWTYRPKELAPEAPVLFVMHGVQRDGERYRDEWLPYAERAYALLLVPEFSASAFPGSRNYSAARPAKSARDNDETAPAAYLAIDKIFDWVVKTAGLKTSEYRIYGHSAGAQFVHRFVLFNSSGRAKIAVAANAGWYT